MSYRQPSRLSVLVNVLVLQAYTVVATLYLASGRAVLGAIWASCSLLWVWTVMTWVKTYGNQRETAAWREMRWSRS